MARGYFDGAELTALYQELEHECAEYARQHGSITAAQENEIAARLMQAARGNPPAPASADPSSPSA
jgi:hypothetical protein